MSAQLTDADRSRLIAILGRLGSDFAGERDAAALAAVRLLRARGLDWRDVVAPPTPCPPPPPRPGQWRERVQRCRARPAELRPWESEFLAALERFPRLSAKQAAILNEIAERLGVLAEVA